MMARLLIFKALFLSTFLLHPFAGSGIPVEKENRRPVSYISKNVVVLSDTSIYQRQDKKKDKGKEKPDERPQPNQPDKPDIREVPKARNQGRPPVVVRPNIKVKPIKIVRPKIKRP